MPFFDIYFTSVVVDDFDVSRTVIGPTEIHSKMIGDLGTVLVLAICF